MNLKEDLVDWARLSRENNLNKSHETGMMKKAYEIDEFLREIGIEWIKDYEENQKIKAHLKNDPEFKKLSTKII
jgi:hypothetical protein